MLSSSVLLVFLAQVQGRAATSAVAAMMCRQSDSQDFCSRGNGVSCDAVGLQDTGSCCCSYKTGFCQVGVWQPDCH